MDVRVITTDIEALARQLEVDRKQMSYAASVALNWVALDTYQAERAHLQQVFKIHSQNLLRFATPTTLGASERATRDRLYVVIEPKKWTMDLLAPFVEGIPKKQVDALFPLAWHTQEIDPTNPADRKLYPTNLGLAPRRTVTGTKTSRVRVTTTKQGKPVVIYAGKENTFALVPGVQQLNNPKAAGIYQRLSNRPGDIRMIWAYTPMKPRPAVLQWVPVAEVTIDRQFGPRMLDAIDLALRTAKP